MNVQCIGQMQRLKIVNRDDGLCWPPESRVHRTDATAATECDCGTNTAHRTYSASYRCNDISQRINRPGPGTMNRQCIEQMQLHGDGVEIHAIDRLIESEAHYVDVMG